MTVYILCQAHCFYLLHGMMMNWLKFINEHCVHLIHVIKQRGIQAVRKPEFLRCKQKYRVKIGREIR